MEACRLSAPWRSVKLTRVALRFIDPESLPIPFQVVGFSVRWWVNLSEQKWVNSGERYRRGGLVGGACGVGGGTDEQDEDCARAGIAKL
jgi:hypothetical protein